jgi:Domain of unknown function (DUF4375)
VTPQLTTADCLAQALSARSTGEFLNALAHAVTPPSTATVPLDHLPEVVRMLRVLCALELCVATDGVRKFLLEHELGALLEPAAAWSEQLGAPAMSEYLREAAHVFPRGQVPRDDRRRGNFVVKESDRENDRFARLDARYPAAAAELEVRLREYVSSNQTAIVAAVDTIPAPAPPTGRVESALEAMERLRADFNRPARRKSDATVFDGARVDRFLDEIGEMSVDAWVMGLGAWRETHQARRKKAHATVFNVVSAIRREIDPSPLAPERKAFGATIRERDVRGRAVADRISQQLGSSATGHDVGKELAGLLSLAATALGLKQRLVETQRGREAVATILYPFEVMGVVASTGPSELPASQRGRRKRW